MTFIIAIAVAAVFFVISGIATQRAGSVMFGWALGLLAFIVQTMTGWTY